jgi:hypothetical protein
MASQVFQSNLRGFQKSQHKKDFFHHCYELAAISKYNCHILELYHIIYFNQVNLIWSLILQMHHLHHHPYLVVF